MPDCARRLFVALFAGWMMLCAADIAAQEPAPSEASPNVVLILFDDMGWGDLGCYGGANATPHMDALAAQGLRADAFYVAQPVCSASRAAYLTGRLPHRIGVRGALFPDARNGLPDAELTFAEVLHARGYATAVFGKWHLGHTAPFHPLQHGFDEFCGIPYSHDMAPASPYANGRFAPLPLWDGARVARTDPAFEELTELFTQRACDFIRRKKDVPFCVYLPHPMPHTPLAASAAFRGSTGRGLYADVLAELDASVGTVLKTLEDCGVAERTLVMLASDNGPWLQMGSHSGSAGPLREGKGTTFDGGVRVPFIARWPGHIPAGTVCRTPFGAVDICPTIADMVGVRLDARKLDGRSALPLLLDPSRTASPSDSYALYYDGPELRSLRSGRWKLHLPHDYRSLESTGKPGVDGMPGSYGSKRIGLELFEIAADRTERKAVNAEHPEVVRALQAQLEANIERDAALTRRVQRCWPGPQWCPSRLQDWWRVDDELRCTDAQLPFRTLHQLTTRVSATGEMAEPLHIEAQLRWSGAAGADACAGFIIGVGNEQIDRRTSALVQQAPGKEGGLLAVVCEDGSVRLLDFSVAAADGGMWTLPTAVRWQDLPQLAATEIGLLSVERLRMGSVLLRVSISAHPEGRFGVQVTVLEEAKVLARTPEALIDHCAIDGGYGLVAQHAGADGFGFSEVKAHSASKGWLRSDPTREFGPIFGTLHTIENNAAGEAWLRLSAALAPLAAQDWGTFALDLRISAASAWEELATGHIDEASSTVVFPAVLIPAHREMEWRVRGMWLAEENTFWGCESTGWLR